MRATLHPEVVMTIDLDAGCFHGGAFFDAVGDSFDDLSRRHQIINADVLDAWFPPARGCSARSTTMSAGSPARRRRPCAAACAWQSRTRDTYQQPTSSSAPDPQR